MAKDTCTTWAASMLLGTPSIAMITGLRGGIEEDAGREMQDQSSRMNDSKQSKGRNAFKRDMLGI